MSDYLNYITEKNEVCDRCGKNLPKGTRCEATEDFLYCMSCIYQLEANADIQYEDWRVNQSDVK